MKSIINFLLVYFSLFLMPMYGQTVHFKSLTTDNGLSQISVNSIFQDENRLVWIGTRDGLNRYDGQNIRIFKLEKNNPNSLFCNNVLQITGNKKGRLFLRCTEGICAFDFRTEQFRVLATGDYGAILYKDELYIARKNEIYIWNDSIGRYEFFYQLLPKDASVSWLEKDNQNRLWIGTRRNGVYILNLDTQEITQPLDQGNVASIFIDSQNEIWVSTWHHGLFRYAGDQEYHYTYRAECNSIASDFIRSCCEDNQGNIWIGTIEGLNKFDKKTGLFQLFTAGQRPGDMTHSSVWQIIKDHQGTLWLGTYFGGVNFFNPEYEIYTTYDVSYNNQQSQGTLSFPIVGRMQEDRHRNLWICTEGGGLNVYDRSTGKFRWYRKKTKEAGLSHDNVKALYLDEEEDVAYIGTHLGGINKLDLKTDRFTHFYSRQGDSTSLPHNIVRDIIPAGKDSLYVATHNGVCLFSKKDGGCRQLFRHLPQGDLITMVGDLFVDSRNQLWMSVAGEGVFVYDTHTDSLRQFKYQPSGFSSISNNNINSIMEDCAGRLWFSTSGSGVDVFDPEKNTFENFDSRKNGLASDCVYEICESKDQRLLIITNKGFSQFDYLNQQFINHNKDNGFPLSTVNENALFLSSTGEVFLGGIQGMISFKEKDLDFQAKSYDILFTNLYVNGNQVKVGDDTRILPNSLLYTSQIVLDADQSIFQLEFATTNYILANRDELVYRLEGFSEEWSNLRDQNSIAFTNLSPGNYTLVIKNSDVSPIPVRKEMKIRVLPPFYRTGVAYGVYLLLILIASWLIIRAYKAKVRLEESLKYEQKHLQDIETLNQAKLRFFTNISHEFRTPLTIIIGQIENLLHQQVFTPAIYKKVLNVYQNSLQLRGLISELLDFRKQEQGHMQLKVREQDIVGFLQENFLLFSEYAESLDIRFSFEKEIDSLHVWYDQRQLQKVVNNLLSNAFKHCKANDRIQLRVYADTVFVYFEVVDSGTGIPKEEVEKIFERFYQISHQSENILGTGIGLALTKGIIDLHHGDIRVESEPARETVFRVSLKLGKQHFQPEQIDSEKVVEEADVIFPDELFLKYEKPEVQPELPVVREGTVMLIVEDNTSLRDMLSSIFGVFYTVVTAADGVEALEKVEEQQPSIILSDVMMPRMNGTELCKRIKGNMETCHIPVVLLTARIAIEHNLEGLGVGADDYITKPFNTETLISRCNNLVNGRILLQEKFSGQFATTPQMLATNALDKEFLDKATVVIDKYLSDPEFNVNLFSREMGIARTKLFMKIKAITGQTPNDFISTIRLKRGASLLVNHPEMSVTEVAELTGFGSPRYFSKCFKDYFKITPLMYRKGENVQN